MLLVSTYKQHKILFVAPTRKSKGHVLHFIWYLLIGPAKASSQNMAAWEKRGRLSKPARSWFRKLPLSSLVHTKEMLPTIHTTHTSSRTQSRISCWATSQRHNYPSLFHIKNNYTRCPLQLCPDIYSPLKFRCHVVVQTDTSFPAIAVCMECVVVEEISVPMGSYITQHIFYCMQSVSSARVYM